MTSARWPPKRSSLDDLSDYRRWSHWDDQSDYQRSSFRKWQSIPSVNAVRSDYQHVPRSEMKSTPIVDGCQGDYRRPSLDGHCSSVTYEWQSTLSDNECPELLPVRSSLVGMTTLTFCWWLSPVIRDFRTSTDIKFQSTAQGASLEVILSIWLFWTELCFLNSYKAEISSLEG